MSWAAHDLEPYVFQRKLRTGAAISFVAVVLDTLAVIETLWQLEQSPSGSTVFPRQVVV